MTELPNLKDWKVAVDLEGIAWAIFDREGESANSLGRRPLEELGQIVEFVEKEAAGKKVTGLVFMSGKEKGFIVGADIREFDQLDTEAKVIEGITPVNAMLDRIERLAGPGRGGDSRRLRRRRARAGARLPLPHRHPRRCDPRRLPGGQARHLPRLQRDRPLDPPGRPDRRR